MPSGYEQSPDYGGPEPSWRAIAVVIIVMAPVVMIAL